MIVARHVTVRASRRTLVDEVSLACAAGEVLALVGPNGAGKSTLLGALAGDRALDTGEVRIADRPIAGLSARALASLRAVLPQAPALAAGFSALEVVQLGQGAPDEADARRRLDDVELGALAHRAYPTLSGGERQRVQLARVLAQLGDRGGKALLLDEPTASLDPRHHHQVLGLARRAASRGHAVVVVLHDLSAAARWADRIAVLDRGRLAALGPPREALDVDVLRAVFAIDFDVLTHPSGRPVLVAGQPLELP